jgi:hypothetical protein
MIGSLVAEAAAGAVPNRVICVRLYAWRYRPTDVRFCLLRAFTWGACFRARWHVYSGFSQYGTCFRYNCRVAVLAAIYPEPERATRLAVPPLGSAVRLPGLARTRPRWL